MKKPLFVLLSLSLLFSLAGCRDTLTAPEGLIEKAREVIPVADADSIDMQIVGSIEKEGGNALIWFMSGSAQQAHYYLPMECTLESSDTYEYVRAGKPYERGDGLVAYPWQGGYAFLVNRESCKSILITSETETHTIEIGEADSYPFLCYEETVPSAYAFLDASGNELS